MKKSVLGVAETDAQADAIVSGLEAIGLSTQDISVIFPDKQGTRDFAHQHNTKAPEGAVTGASAGGVVGGTIGLLAGVGALAIPGLGPFIAAGPLMAALSGAAAGAAVGGLTGALIGLGIPEIEAKLYEGKIRGGNIFIAAHVETDGQEAKAKDVFETNNAHDVSSTRETSVPKAETRVGR